MMSSKTQTAADKMYHDACVALNVEPKTMSDFTAMFEDEDEAKSFHALHRITRVIKACKNGQKFDWNDYYEDKYYPVWDMETYEDAPAGSGFSFDDSDCAYTCSSVGARLSVDETQKGRHIWNHFGHIWSEWWEGK